MKRTTRVLLLGSALLLLLPATALLTAPSDQPAAESMDASPEPAVQASGPAWVLDAELQASRDGFQARLAALTARFQAAASEEEALAIQREISRLKLESELAVMEIQARRAREAGKADLAQEIESIVSQVRAAADAEAAAQAPSSAPDAPTPPPASGR